MLLLFVLYFSMVKILGNKLYQHKYKLVLVLNLAATDLYKHTQALAIQCNLWLPDYLYDLSTQLEGMNGT